MLRTKVKVKEETLGKRKGDVRGLPSINSWKIVSEKCSSLTHVLLPSFLKSLLRLQNFWVVSPQSLLVNENCTLVPSKLTKSVSRTHILSLVVLLPGLSLYSRLLLTDQKLLIFINPNVKLLRQNERVEFTRETVNPKLTVL